jgi:hypothetical protein
VAYERSWEGDNLFFKLTKEQNFDDNINLVSDLIDHDIGSWMINI